MKRGIKICLYALLMLSSVACLLWRAVYTLPLDTPAAMIPAVVLLVTELLGAAEMLTHFYVLLRGEPIGTPEKAGSMAGILPDVDVFIPTCGEPVSLLRGTVAACRKMKYPREKLHIYLCDDANSPEMRTMAEKAGINYLYRREAVDAKAGNLNAALAQSTSPFVAVFDADMQPRPYFLMHTVPYLLQDERLGFVQTPQHFRNADLFQPFFIHGERACDEQAFFYQCIEPAASRFSGVILAGSNALVRREALEAAGGFATWTLTEDFATGMEIERLGYTSLALKEVLADGLFPERFTSLIRQRRRWARGCIRSGRQGKKKGLSLLQRLHYAVSVHYWFFPVKRLIYLCMPLLFALFGIPVMRADLGSMAIFWLPMYLLSIVCLRAFSGGLRTMHRSIFYEYCLAPYLLGSVLAEALGFQKKTFEVTEKGQSGTSVSTGMFLRLLLPYLLLLVLTAAGLVRVLLTLTSGALPLFLLFWLVYDAVLLLQTIFFLFSCRKRGVLA